MRFKPSRFLQRALLPAVLTGLSAALLAGPAQGAAPRLYLASVSGAQELSWRVDGTTKGCETHHGAGSGKVAFHFRSGRMVPVGVFPIHGLQLNANIVSKAAGTIEGAFTDSVSTPCPGEAPEDSFTYPTTGCGATKFQVRVDTVYRPNGYVYVSGPNVLGSNHKCYFPADNNVIFAGNGSDGCNGSSSARNLATGTSQGEGLLPSRFAVKPRALLHLRRGQRRILTGKAKFECTDPSIYSGGIVWTGKLTYAITVKRTI